MKTFCTEIRAIDPKDGKLKTWVGQNIQAISWEDAEAKCQNGLGYLKVTGELIESIPLINGEADFSKKVSYQNLN